MARIVYWFSIANTTLDYAKLTRKLGAKAAAELPIAALRRSIDGGGYSAL